MEDWTQTENLSEIDRFEEETPLLVGPMNAELEKAITDKLMGIKGRSEQFYAGRRVKWLDYFNHYMNRKREKSRTTIPMPLASEHVDVALSDTLGEFFASSPLVSLKGTTREDKMRAPTVEKLLNWQFDKMDISDIAYSVLKSAYIYGSCPHRVVWDQKIVEVPVPGGYGEMTLLEYSGPTIIWYDIFDYFPDSSKVRPNDAAAYGVRMFQPYEYLEQRADMHPELYFDVHLVPHKRTVNMQTDDLDARQERQMVMGMSPEATERGLIEIFEWDMWWPVKQKDGTFISRPCVFTTANGKLVRATRNNYITQNGCFGLACPDRIPNDLFGIGLVEKMHPNIHGANSVLDMILTNLELTVDKQKVVSRDQVKNPEQVKRNHSGNIIWANGDARQAVHFVDGGDISADAYSMLAMFKANSEAASGVTPQMKGGMQKGVTATASMQGFQKGSARFRLFLQMFAGTFLKPSAQFMHKINQQFLDLPAVIPVLEGDAEDWITLDPQTMAIDPDFVVEAPHREANRQMEIAQIENFLAILAGIQPLYPVIPALVGKLARQFRWDEAKEIEQLAQAAVQNFLIMNALLQAQAGGQGGSPSSGGKSRQTGSKGNLAGIESTNSTDLNQSLLGGRGASAFA